MSTDQQKPAFKHSVIKVVVVTTAMLTFISFWRAAALVLCDLASSVFYAAGIAEQAIGRGAPWMILAVMVFSLCVRLLYVESCGMFVRGGVYRVVKSALGGTFAKVAVSALMFDYVLTGPVSSVAAGQYLIGLVNQVLPLLHVNYAFPRDYSSMVIALFVIVYFWRKNVRGIEESSSNALRIMQVTTMMAVILFSWSLITLAVRGVHFPPFEIRFSNHALGWLENVDWAKTVGFIGIMIAFGHSVLAMSGEETLAQVYREIESPKMPNLKKAVVVITIFSFVSTAGLSMLSFMIIPDDIRTTTYQDNLLSGLAMHVAGPHILRMVMQFFVVFVGFLILSGAVNTSMVGANGVLNRVAEDGILTDWFRTPHKKFGTSSRIIDMVAVLQIITVLACRGNIYALGEAYAFGVIWSYTFNAMAMLALRFKDRSKREFKVPLNFTIGRVEIPAGLTFIFVALFLTALTNFFTKTVATTWGLSFTAIFFTIFLVSQIITKRRLTAAAGFEKVNLVEQERLTPESCESAKAHRVLLAVRDPNNLFHLKRCLQDIDPDQTDLIIMTAKIAHGFQADIKINRLAFEEEHLFTNVITVAEKAGVSVIPVVIASNNFYYAITKTAYDLNAQEIILGLSGKISADLQMEQLAMFWGNVSGAEPRPMVVRIIWPTREFKCQLS
jgi:amino acid transporter